MQALARLGNLHEGRRAAIDNLLSPSGELAVDKTVVQVDTADTLAENEAEPDADSRLIGSGERCPRLGISRGGGLAGYGYRPFCRRSAHPARLFCHLNRQLRTPGEVDAVLRGAEPGAGTHQLE